jgi:DNA-binding CsgD family transcriptional regulator
MTRVLRGVDLVGRAAECREIDELLAAARAGHGRALLLRGEAGIGKTALLQYALRHATGMRVLAARGIEAESEIPFSGLSELVQPLLDRIGELPARQAEALAGALALGPPTGSDPFAVGAATLSLVTTAAADEPVLAIVDDLQWLDDASLQAILFAARRVEAEPAAMLLAMRDDGTGPGRRLGVPVRFVTGLDRAASIRLAAGSDQALIPNELADRLFLDTGGNPLALLELPMLMPRGLVAGLEDLGSEPLPVTERIERVFASRASRLSADAHTALLVAAANDAADVDPVLATLDALGIGRAGLEEAEAAGLLTIDGVRLEFRHPLVRSSVYQGAGPAECRAIHRTLAAAFPDDDGPGAARQAWHLALSVVGHDDGVASVLDRAATSAWRRAGFVAAAHAWERAGRLSSDSRVAARRLYQAADAWQLSNHHGRALALLDEAELVAEDRLVLADIVWLRGRINAHRCPDVDAIARLQETAEDVLDIDPGRALRLLTTAVATGISSGHLCQSLDAAERAYGLAPPPGDPLELVASLQLGKIRVLTGDVSGGYPLIMRAVELLARDCPVERDADLVQCAPALLAVEEYDLDERILLRVIRAQRADHALGLLAYSLAALSELDVRRGRWGAAEANGAESVQLAREAGQAGQLSFNLARLARIDAARGRDELCRDRVAQALDIAGHRNYESSVPFAESSLGLLELGRGRLPDAIRHLDAAGRSFHGMGFRIPGRLEWQVDLAEAYLRAGRVADAEAELENLEGVIEACRRPNGEGEPAAGCLLASAGVARCRGLLASPGECDRWFAKALDWHARTTVPFELARTELYYGEQLRRAGRKAEARTHLGVALGTFDRLDADPWGERARAELAATGERPEARRDRPLEELTAQELQVAMLVAGGATNREAGAALFLTPKTIEFHLAKIYRKLDLRSRTELAAWAARQLPPAAG